MRGFRAGKLLAICGLLASALAAQPVALHRFAKSGKYGYRDDNGTVRIPAQYDGALEFNQGVAPAAIAKEEVYERGKAGAGCKVQARKWGFIDAAGNVVLPFQFEDAKPFRDGMAAVLSGGKWGFIDRSGQWAIRPAYDLAESFQDGVALVFLAESNLFIDRTGRVLLKSPRRMRYLGEGLAAFGSGPYGIIDVHGSVVQAPRYREIAPFSESLAAAASGDGWGFIDHTGAFVIAPTFSSPENYWETDFAFHEGLSKMYSEGKLGYIDRSGRFVIAPKFISGGNFQGGMAYACVDARQGPVEPESRPDPRCGFIDKSGAFVISPRFGSASSFEGGLAEVRDPVFSGLIVIDRKGRIVDRPKVGEEPSFEPYGECDSLPPETQAIAASPPPEVYLVKMNLNSTPTGATLYLVPIWDWDTYRNGTQLLSNPDALASYLVPMGVTPFREVGLKAQAYMGVFELAGKRKVVRVVVAKNGNHQLTVSF